MGELKGNGCRISGTGSYVPEKILTNDDLSHIVDTNDEWISSRTGIKERRIMGDDETRTHMSVMAAKAAIEDAGIKPEDIDYIICAIMYGDYITPSHACCVQHELGITCPAFDINTACSGFLFALDVAQSFIKTKKNINRVLVIATESMSRIVDWTDRATCVLFGDGSGAAVVERCEEDDLISFAEHAQGNAEVLYIDNGEKSKPAVRMNGTEVFKFAVTSAQRDINEALEAANLKMEDIDHVILHQANKRITNSVISKLGLPEEKFVSTIHKYGNTCASGVAMALDEAAREGRLKNGDIIAFAAFGGGLSSAASIVRWNK